MAAWEDIFVHKRHQDEWREKRRQKLDFDLIYIILFVYLKLKGLKTAIIIFSDCNHVKLTDIL